MAQLVSLRLRGFAATVEALVRDLPWNGSHEQDARSGPDACTLAVWRSQGVLRASDDSIVVACAR